MITFIWQKDWEDLALVVAQRLIDAGHDLTIHTRGAQLSAAGRGKDSKALATALSEVGKHATKARSISAALADAQIVITLLSGPQEVEDVYLGAGGILECAGPAGLFIDLSTSDPKLSKEIYALSAVHDHRFVEAPIGGDVDLIATGNIRLFAASEPDNLAAAREILGDIADEVCEMGLPGCGVAMKLASQIALAGALMGVVEAISFAKISGVTDAQIIENYAALPHMQSLLEAFGKRVLDEDFYYGLDMGRFYSDLDNALSAADAMELALPGLETAHQLYDLLVLVGGGGKGIHALALIYYDEEHCSKHGLNWALAQKAMDVYERGGEEDYDDYYFDDEDCDDPDCDHHHHHHHHGDDEPPGIKGYFSHN